MDEKIEKYPWYSFCHSIPRNINWQIWNR
jgi:hypothetical protein